MTDTVPYIAAFWVLVIGTLVGMAPMRKLITVREARHELRQGSAGFLRAMAGWIVIVLWIAGVWFFGTIIGDWARTGDLVGAIERAQLRLWILLELLAALGD